MMIRFNLIKIHSFMLKIIQKVNGQQWEVINQSLLSINCILQTRKQEEQGSQRDRKWLGTGSTLHSHAPSNLLPPSGLRPQ